MKKIINLSIICIVFLGCSTRKKQLEISEFRTAEVERIKKDSISETKQIQDQKTSKKTEVDNKSKKENTNVEIKGKTDSLSDFNYNYISGKDTLRIYIKGNADFNIKSNIEKTEEKVNETKEFENLNIVQEIARKTVSQETIKETAEKIREKTIDKTQRGFTFGAWVTWFLWFIVIVCAVWLFYYFGGKINFGAILRKFKNKNNG